MTHRRESRRLPYSPEQIFDLVADVEGYPRFLPLWREARVRRPGPGEDRNLYHTVQVLQLGPVRRQFVTRTRLYRPDRIHVSSRDPLFRTFSIHWRFDRVDGAGCRVDFDLRCEARSPLLRPVFETVLAGAARDIVSAFEHRARVLYGGGTPRSGRTPGGPGADG